MSDSILDDLHIVSPRRVGRAAFSAIDALQAYTPKEQILGAGVVLVVLMRRYAVELPGDLLTIARNVLNRATEYVPELRGVERYVKNEHRN